MTTTPATIALVATIALGVVVGILYLQRVRRPLLVKAHLWVGLAATALVAVLVATRPSAPEGPSGLVPLLLVAGSAAAGWSAFRYIRRARTGSELALAAHAVAGVAGFLVFLSWIRTP